MPSSPPPHLSAEDFLAAVLHRAPRTAVFDCDGTLWSNNSGEDFFYWSMEAGMVSDDITRWARARYEDYRRGSVGEETMCGEMTTMYAGLRVTDLEAAAARFFEEKVRPNYFPEMRRLTLALRAAGCELWAVSSTNEWVVREGIKDFAVPPGNVIAATARCQAGVVTATLTRMPSGEGKAEGIREVIQNNSGSPAIDVVFGNSIHDAAMLRLARHGFAVNPNPDLAGLAEANGWTVYWPEGVLAR